MIGGTARRRTAYTLPASPTTFPISTYDGSGQSTHASVMDMGVPWNGYRWWMANTPYPSVGGDHFENPCIYASHDRVTWVVPDGLTNPIYPWSGIQGEYNSDTELAWDDVRRRLVCYWREYKPGVGGISFLAASSADGVTWAQHGTRVICPDMSPGIAKGPDGWRIYTFPGAVLLADDVLGPWTVGPPCDPIGGRHGDAIYHDGLWWSIGSTDTRSPRVGISVDGYTWHVGSPTTFTVGYRPTMLISTEAGYMDVWASRANIYCRVPLTTWTDLL